MVRVIAGSQKGKQLKVLDIVTRPLTDRIKSSVFDLIVNYIPESSILDLFGGSGNFAIEALSRGANSATILEKDDKAVNIIKENLVKTGLTSKVKVLGRNTFVFLASKDVTITFDIIFLDPPFDFTIEDKQKLLNLSGKFLKNENPDALIIFRYPKTETYRTKTTHEIYSKIYGISKVSFFKRKIKQL